jgi:hypothetical protein
MSRRWQDTCSLRLTFGTVLEPGLPQSRNTGIGQTKTSSQLAEDVMQAKQSRVFFP